MSYNKPSVIILIILVVLVYTMQHTKFQSNQSIDSGEDFLRIFTTYGHAGHVTRTI